MGGILTMMGERYLTCPMCGAKYDPTMYLACNTCPLKRGCELTCCPNCGYKTVYPGNSKLARLAERLLFKKQQDLTESADLDEHGSLQ